LLDFSFLPTLIYYRGGEASVYPYQTAKDILALEESVSGPGLMRLIFILNFLMIYFAFVHLILVVVLLFLFLLV
jgi:hypothetical protein